eukprot:CAMPEP_0204363996 /NCGR_PEP_ID=MMETSP0469-20131031/40790_1 /ASSEMBLY_ACC=CAM_ASM_000384 /TAXON_ID=2969 /ORGANISM="Oxyrrhis marina" /LENGTH=190 /DNA_ID=CAMNT_0051352819 /DNA_START=11 /DNA_END=583 /DNA_ORIENTATION=-
MALRAGASPFVPDGNNPADGFTIVDSPSAAVQQRFLGRIKSFEPRNGYGFIECLEFAEKNCDVFVHKDLMGQLQVGDPVQFNVIYNQKNQPQARNLALTRETPPEVVRPRGNIDETDRFQGTIKSFQMQKGFGFIACDALHHRFGRDVFLHKDQLGGLPVGCKVTFRAKLNRQQQPQAMDVTRDDTQDGH